MFGRKRVLGFNQLEGIVHELRYVIHVKKASNRMLVHYLSEILTRYGVECEHIDICARDLMKEEEFPKDDVYLSGGDVEGLEGR